MKKTVFEISKMDCPSEERLIRMKLEGNASVRKLEFDIPERLVSVYYSGGLPAIENAIKELKLGGKVLSTVEAGTIELTEDADQKRLLWVVLWINLAFFVVEISTGVVAKSMGLVADSLDMLADAFVYGISLMAVGKSVVRKKNIAKAAGYFQITLAFIGFIEVLRRFSGAEQMPDFSTMIVVSILALLANSICLYLLQKSKSKDEAHMKASMIFTSNDVIINLGVIVAALLVHWLNSGIPDLVIGSIVFVLVIQGAFRILKLAR